MALPITINVLGVFRDVQADGQKSEKQFLISRSKMDSFAAQIRKDSSIKPIRSSLLLILMAIVHQRIWCHRLGDRSRFVKRSAGHSYPFFWFLNVYVRLKPIRIWL